MRHSLSALRSGADKTALGWPQAVAFFLRLAVMVMAESVAGHAVQ